MKDPARCEDPVPTGEVPLPRPEQLLSRASADQGCGQGKCRHSKTPILMYFHHTLHFLLSAVYYSCVTFVIICVFFIVSCCFFLNLFFCLSLLPRPHLLCPPSLSKRESCRRQPALGPSFPIEL